MEQESKYAQALAKLSSQELREATGDPERMADMFERLLNSAALTVAMMAAGDKRAMSELLIGAEGYLYDRATAHARVAQFLNQQR